MMNPICGFFQSVFNLKFFKEFPNMLTERLAYMDFLANNQFIIFPLENKTEYSLKGIWDLNNNLAIKNHKTIFNSYCPRSPSFKVYMQIETSISCLFCQKYFQLMHFFANTFGTTM